MESKQIISSTSSKSFWLHFFFLLLKDLTFHISLNIWEKADYMCQFYIGSQPNVTQDDRFNAEHWISHQKKSDQRKLAIWEY